LFIGFANEYFLWAIGPFYIDPIFDGVTGQLYNKKYTALLRHKLVAQYDRLPASVTFGLYLG
jgi:hypothetical protein